VPAPEAATMQLAVGVSPGIQLPSPEQAMAPATSTQVPEAEAAVVQAPAAELEAMTVPEAETPPVLPAQPAPAAEAAGVPAVEQAPVLRAQPVLLPNGAAAEPAVEPAALPAAEVSLVCRSTSGRMHPDTGKAPFADCRCLPLPPHQALPAVGGVAAPSAEAPPPMAEAVPAITPAAELTPAAAAPAAEAAPLAPGPAAEAVAAQANCTDTPPDSRFTCQQQQRFGKCNEPWMVQGNFCAATCGRCTPAEAPVSPATEGRCTDTRPDSRFTCQQQQRFGKCNEPWMVQGNFCAATCGRCRRGGGGGGGDGTNARGAAAAAG
jgi:hypothetical protein